MKKIFIMVLSAVCLLSLAKAQYQTPPSYYGQPRPQQNYSRPLYFHPDGSELSVGIEGALPLGGWDDGYNSKVASVGFGATLKYGYNFNAVNAITLESGCLYFPGNDLGGAKINSTLIPIKLGWRGSIQNFYFEPQLGVNFLDASAKATDGLYGSAYGSATGFAYALGIGFFVSRNFDVNLKFERFSNSDGAFTFLALRLAYVFPLSHRR